jgi:hypothetical protein
MRYAMQIAQDPVSNVALSLFGINSQTAYVELTDDTLVIREGMLFQETFPLTSLGRAELTTWEWYMGLGIRTDFQGIVAPITSFEKVIAVSLLQEQKLFIPLLGFLGLQVPCRRIVFSLQNADTFMTTFNAGKVHATDGPTSVEIE